jgi:hypothetical protein
MKNFSIGLIVGIAFAIGGYKPYQIEMEYRDNIAAGLGTPGLPTVCITGVTETPFVLNITGRAVDAPREAAHLP